MRGQGASGSKLRRIASTISLIRVAERMRLSCVSSAHFARVCMKCPFTKDGPGRPVSPGGSSITVDPSGPVLLNGTINTESFRSLRFLWSRETISTQWRIGGLPRLAVHISPRRGNRLLVKVDSRSALRECRFQFLFHGSLFVGHVREIGGGIVGQSLTVLVDH